MKIRICEGDVISATADAIILTIDGSGPGMGGSIARAFMRRWPDAWKEVVDVIKLPIPLGGAVAVDVDKLCPFKSILVASTLHHVDVLSSRQRANVVRQALSDCLRISGRHGLKTVATAVMTGGWRLPIELAFEAMLDACSMFGRNKGTELEMLIYVLEGSMGNKLSRIFQSRELSV